MVRSPPTLLHLPVGQLRKRVLARTDRYGHHYATFYQHAIDSVGTEIPNLPQCLMQCGLTRKAEPGAFQGTTVGHSCQDHPSVGVGERHGSLGYTSMGNTFFKLDVLALVREGCFKLLRGKFSSRMQAAFRVKHRI